MAELIPVREITHNGLWKNNPALVQLLGLCPLLAVTGSVVNALGLGLATMAVLAGSNIAVSLIRKRVSDAVKIPAFVMIIAAFTTCTELLMKAFTYELYLFVGLIITNCIVMGRAEAFAMKNPPGLSFLDGIGNGLGYSVVLISVAVIRELFGAGKLFGIEIFSLVNDGGWYVPNGLLLLPPSAFFIIGLLIWALRSWKPHQVEAKECELAPQTTGMQEAYYCLSIT